MKMQVETTIEISNSWDKKNEFRHFSIKSTRCATFEWNDDDMRKYLINTKELIEHARKDSESSKGALKFDRIPKSLHYILILRSGLNWVKSWMLKKRNRMRKRESVFIFGITRCWRRNRRKQGF